MDSVKPGGLRGARCLYQRLSVSHLALILNVSAMDIERWVTGDELCPTSIFNAATEVIQAAGGFPEATKKSEPGQPDR
jgi:hypothetical protein